MARSPSLYRFGILHARRGPHHAIDWPAHRKAQHRPAYTANDGNLGSPFQLITELGQGIGVRRKLTFFSPSSAGANRALVRLLQTPAKIFVNHTFHHGQPALVYGPDLESKFGLRRPIFTQVKLVKPGAKFLEPFVRVGARNPGF